MQETVWLPDGSEAKNLSIDHCNQDFLAFRVSIKVESLMSFGCFPGEGGVSGCKVQAAKGSSVGLFELTDEDCHMNG